MDVPPPDDDQPPEDVLALAEQRLAARARKDFAESDRLRDAIAARGWTVQDGRQEYTLVKS